MKNNKFIKVVVWFLCIFVICITIFLIVYILGANDRYIKSQINLGNRYLEGHNYPEAMVAFSNILQIDEYNVDSYIGIADAYIGLGDEELSKLDTNTKSDSYRKNYFDIYTASLNHYTKALEIASLGYNLTQSDEINNKQEDIQYTIGIVEKDLENAQLNEEILIQEEKQANIELTLSSFDFDLLTSIYDLIKNTEVYYLSNEDTKLGYEPLETLLYSYISFLYDNKDAEFLQKFLTIKDLELAKNGDIPWFQMGDFHAKDYITFWEACEDIILCYRAEHKMNKILEIKKMVAEIVGGDFFSNNWSYTDDGTLYTYDKYDQLIEMVDSDGYWNRHEYDEHGNLIKNYSEDMTKTLIYDENNRIIEFHMNGYQKTVYEYEGFVGSDNTAEEHVNQVIYDGSEYVYTIGMFVDVYGNVTTDYSFLF